MVRITLRSVLEPSKMTPTVNPTPQLVQVRSTLIAAATKTPAPAFWLLRLIASTMDPTIQLTDIALSTRLTVIRNTAIGWNALHTVLEGTDNIALGHSAGRNLFRSDSFNIDIGNRGLAGDNRVLRIGDADQVRTFIAGVFGRPVTNGLAVRVNAAGQLGTAPSSERFKDEIKPMGKASEAIFALKPVTFRYKREIDPHGILQFGLVAEEVEKVDRDLVARDSHGEPYTVRYDAVNAMLLNEFLKQHHRVENLESGVAQLTAHFDKQDAKIQKVSAQLATASPSGGGPARVVPASRCAALRSQVCQSIRLMMPRLTFRS